MNLNVSPIDPGRRFPLPAGEKASNWLPCIGAMIRGDKSRKDLNLLQVFSQKLVVQTEKKFSWRELVLPVILILAALLVSGGVFISNLFLNHKIGKLQDWMEKPKVQEDYKTSQELQLHSRRLQATIRQIMRMEQNLATYPNLNSAVIQRIESVAGGKIELMITGYDAETGVLTFQAASPEVIDIPSYILKLQQTALFHSVDYTGYSYENDWYTLSLTGTLEGYEVGGEDE